MERQYLMKSTCIQYPPSEILIIVRESQLNFCDGNVVQAALISFFEYWHNIKIEIASKSKSEDIDLDFIQHHTEEELIKGILSISKSSKTIRAAIKVLEEKGVIAVTNNPNKKYRFDKTKHYIFHPEIINSWLNSTNGKITASQTGNLPHHKREIYRSNTRDYKPEKKDRQKSISVKSSVDLIFPEGLKKNKTTLTQLNKLPNNKAKQSVLDVMGNALKEGKVDKPYPYLTGLVKNYLNDDFMPVDKKTDSGCPYCDSDGIIRWVKTNGIKFDEKCTHDEAEIKSKMKNGSTLRGIKASNIPDNLSHI